MKFKHPTKCPFCGAQVAHSVGLYQEYECGTFARDPDEDVAKQSAQCKRKALGCEAESDTPMTDAACGKGNYIHCVDDDFARGLERELTAAKAHIVRIVAAADKYIEVLQDHEGVEYTQWVCNLADARNAYRAAKHEAKEAKP